VTAADSSVGDCASMTRNSAAGEIFEVFKFRLAKRLWCTDIGVAAF
jgi:hypothetical protein